MILIPLNCNNNKRKFSKILKIKYYKKIKINQKNRKRKIPKKIPKYKLKKTNLN